MADITRRTAKKIARHLESDETVDLAVLMEPKGTYGLGMIALAAMPRTTMRRLKRGATEANEGEGGVAAGFPTRSSVLVVTNRRVLVVPSNGLTFGDPELEISLGGVLVGEIVGKGMGKRMTLVFGDGSAVTVDMQRGQPLDSLVERLGRAN